MLEHFHLQEALQYWVKLMDADAEYFMSKHGVDMKSYILQELVG